MSSTNLALQINSASRAAPLLLGCLFNFLLYGVLIIQLYLFQVTYPNDPIASSKAIVYVVFALESVQTLLVGLDAYRYFAIGFGDLAMLGTVQLQWLEAPVLIGIVSAIVQIYNAWRVSVFLPEGSKLLPFIGLVMLSLFQASCAFAEGAREYQVGVFIDLAPKTSIPCVLWLVSGTLCNTVIAVGLALLLMKSDTGYFPATTERISTLVYLFVGTGTCTALATVVDLILLLTFPRYTFHVTVALCLSKIYSISMMVVQNGRRGKIAQAQDGPLSEIEFTSSETNV